MRKHCTDIQKSLGNFCAVTCHTASLSCVVMRLGSEWASQIVDADELKNVYRIKASDVAIYDHKKHRIAGGRCERLHVQQ